MGQKPTSDWRSALSALIPEGGVEADPAHTPTSSPADEPSTSGSADRLTVFFERKGRGGKQATIIAGFTCDDEELRRLASVIKQRLATGGSARGGEILIQGDRRKEVVEILRSLGYSKISL